MIKIGYHHNEGSTGGGVNAEDDDGDDDESDGVGDDEDGGHLEEARTRTGTRRRLQMRVRRPCTPIHGKRRQYLISVMNTMVMMKNLKKMTTIGDVHILVPVP